MNEGWRLAPWADALYACDGAWWMARKGVPEFSGLKISPDLTAVARFGLRQVRLDRGRDKLLMDEAGLIGWGGNSGFHALNLALQFGAARIILVGFDMHDRDGSHWHGRHEARLNNPTPKALRRWADILDGQGLALEALGVEVLNASPNSALVAFPKVDLKEALPC